LQLACKLVTIRNQTHLPIWRQIIMSSSSLGPTKHNFKFISKNVYLGRIFRAAKAHAFQARFSIGKTQAFLGRRRIKVKAKGLEHEKALEALKGRS
jgi:hypothetical protein